MVIAGGGPAGLSAALVLGRARRRVLVVDDGRPRNHASHAVHGLLGHDESSPAELLRRAHRQLAGLPGVERCHDHVRAARTSAGGFELDTAGGRALRCRRVVIATGVEDTLPPLPGIEAFYGRSAFHCPYCDGWEQRDRALAVVGHDDAGGGELAIELLGWSRDVVLCLHGRDELEPGCRARLQRHGVRIRGERITRLEGSGHRLERILFESGEPLARDALFFNGQCRQRSDLARQLGCGGADPRGVHAERFGRSGVPGVYVVGDASRDVQQVSVAIGEGAAAAVAINAELLREDFP